MDFSFYLEPPEFTQQLDIKVDALAPLSMVSSLPGSYFQSDRKPSDFMIRGLLENALGWHFHADLRAEILKDLHKRAKKAYGKVEPWKSHPWLTAKPSASGSGYVSLLQHHVTIESHQQPESYLDYDDLWSMNLREKGSSFLGGSRNYDARLEDILTAYRKPILAEDGKRTYKSIDISDRGNYTEYSSLSELLLVREGKIKSKSIRPWFPMHYVSPKKRGYVVPTSAYHYRLRTTSQLYPVLLGLSEEIAAPAYLGSNDGWVELNITDHGTI